MTMEYSEQIISSKQIYQIFGNNVKAYRKAQNKTQEELAAALEGACEVQCSPKDRERLCNRKMLEEIGKVITSYMG